jgi:hypothetical protein
MFPTKMVVPEQEHVYQMAKLGDGKKTVQGPNFPQESFLLFKISKKVMCIEMWSHLIQIARGKRTKEKIMGLPLPRG